jgi:hypothetical protein
MGRCAAPESDAVQVPESAFRNLMPMRPDDSVAEKIERLLQDYTCFSNDHILFSKMQQQRSAPVSWRPSSSMNRHRYVNHSSSRHQSVASMMESSRGGGSQGAFRGRGKNFLVNNHQIHDFERALQSALNKITENNFDSLSKRVKEIFDMQQHGNDVARTTKLIITQILQKCYTQVALLNVYCRLIGELRTAANASTRDVIDDVVDDFVNDYVANGLTSVTGESYVHQKTQYDEFCKAVITRSHLIGKHLTILAMIQNFLYVRGTGYLECVLDIYRTGSDGVQQELMLDILLEFVKFDNNLAAKIQEYVGKTKFVSSQRARFKMQDIMEA